jgi:hypothetical protein
MATGQQFHKSSLLGTLAYMGSPASALRNEAASKGLTGGNLFSRDVKPLAVTDTATTNGTVDPQAVWLQSGEAAGGPGGAASAIGLKGIQTVDVTNTTDTNNVVTHTVTVVTNDTPQTNQTTPDTHTDTNVVTRHTVDVTTDTTTRQDTHVETHITNEVVRQVQNLTVNVEGDPHYHALGVTYTHHGTTGDTYLLASGNDVRCVGLYAMNGTWDINVIAAVELQITADPSEGRSKEVRIEYDLNHRDQVVLTTIDDHGHKTSQTLTRNDVQNNNVLGDLAPGYQLQWNSGGGVKLIAPTGNGNGTGTYTVDGSDYRHLEVAQQGNFTNQTGLLSWLTERSTDPSTGRPDSNISIAAKNGDWGEQQIADKYDLNHLAGGAFKDLTLNLNLLRGWGAN